jgi:prolyl oligopeptidase
VNDLLICTYLKDAKTQVKLFDLDGNFVREVDLPTIGTATGFKGKRSHNETFYAFASIAVPPSIYRYDLNTGASELLRRPDVAFDPDDFEVKQVFYHSKDGTRVPMFIAHKKGIQLNRRNATRLFGYGGFGHALTPLFAPWSVQWMEMGGVLAIPNLRGGGEYGEEWHKAGMKLQKQNVFDDFIAAAEWLIDQQYTSPEHIGIHGYSNGGLLVAACMMQRPDLFGACLPSIAVTDMLRFHQFTAGRLWIEEYGCSEDSQEEYEALRAYSPYHNIRDGVEYPPTLVTTGDMDDRVIPAHSFKFAARLQQAQRGDAPALIRIDTRAGHWDGKPTTMVIEEFADQWAFMVEHLDMTPTIPGD